MADGGNDSSPTDNGSGSSSSLFTSSVSPLVSDLEGVEVEGGQDKNDSPLDDSYEDESYSVRADYADSRKRKLVLSSSEESAVLSELHGASKRPRPRDPPEGQSQPHGDSSSGSPSDDASGPSTSGSPSDEASGRASGASTKLTDVGVDQIASGTARQATDYLTRGVMSEDQRDRIKKTLTEFKRPPTFTEINQFFAQKIGEYQEKIDVLKLNRSRCLTAADEFWTAVRLEQTMKIKAKLGRHTPRPRKKAAKSRAPLKCPLTGCPGTAVNIRRHLAQCHRYLTRADQSALMAKHRVLLRLYAGKDAPPRPSVDPSAGLSKRKRYPERKCSECRKVVRRLDVHAVRVHHAKRQSALFRKILRQSVTLEGSQVEEEVEVAAGTVSISATDELKNLLRDFALYLVNSTSLGPATIKAQTRMVGDIIKHELGEGSGQTLTGSVVCRLFEDIDNVEPPGFIRSKINKLSYNYIRKLVFACRRCMTFLAQSDNEHYKLDEAEQRRTMNRLVQISTKYYKAEKKTLPQARIRKERENVTLDAVARILKAPHITTTMEGALRCQVDESVRPCSVAEYTQLRDVLITVLMIKSLRRLMEFTEFRLSEYIEAEKLVGPSPFYVIRIARHKTAAYGPSLLYLSEFEKRVLDSFVQFYRPLASDCASADCLVFPTRTALRGEPCCSRMTFSNLSRAVKVCTMKCASEAKVTSRIIRRSQITALWEKHTDPAWRQKLAEQCGHSLATASRYYEFSNKVAPGKEVVEELAAMRDAAADAPEDTSTEESGSPAPEEAQDSPVPEPTGEGATSEPEFLHPTQVLRVEIHKVESAHSPPSERSVPSPDAAPSGSELSEAATASAMPSGSVLTGEPSASGFPSGSVLSLRSTDRAGASHDLTVSIKDNAHMYRDLNRAVKACNRSRGEGTFVKWREVKAVLEGMDDYYQKMTPNQIKEKYKYLTRLKKSLQ